MMMRRFEFPGAREERAPVDRDIDAERLRDYCRAFNAPKSFAVGDLICALASGSGSPNNLFVVIEVFVDPHVYFTRDNGSDFGRRFDLRIAWYDGDGDLSCCGADSRDFRAATEEDTRAPAKG